MITGASQGIGAGLVAGHRRLGYCVVANARNVTASDDPMVLAVPGDIAQPGVGQHIVDAVLYLESSLFVTGEILNVDGGRSAGR